MKNGTSNKVADVSNVLPGEADDFNPLDAFDDEDQDLANGDYSLEDAILSADEEFLAYIAECSESVREEQLNRDSVEAGE